MYNAIMRILKSKLGLVAACAVLVLASSTVPAAGPSNQAGHSRPNPQGATGRSEVPVVKLLVNVWDKGGRFTRDMRQEEFRIFEDGMEQKIVQLSYVGVEPLIVGLMIDTSGSRRGQMPGAEREPAKRFFREALVGKSLGFVVTFGEKAYMDSDVTADFAQLDRAIDRGVGEQRGSSALFDAVYAACERASAGLGRRALVMITDGEDNNSQTTLEGAIEIAQRTQTTLFIVRVQVAPRDPQGYAEALHKKKPV